MVAHIHTVAFLGIDAIDIQVQVQISSGLPAFTIVGLPDKAVAESRERVRAALSSMGLALPAKRITVNLSPADIPKEGSHYDLPIALGLMAAMEVIPLDELHNFVVIGELGLDGSIAPVTGALLAAIQANAHDKGLFCPQACGPEAAWSGNEMVLAANTLLAIINHLKGHHIIAPARKGDKYVDTAFLDLSDIKGQETGKRALEIAASGGHNLLMSGPPGSGKSMLAARLPGLLPPMDMNEALSVSMIHSVSGMATETGISLTRPYRDPHHSTSVPALVGGGNRVKPGEISLAHNGVLFLDELPEFPRATLEALRQPLETGKVTIARANSHITYPANFQLVAAMNPCRCGYLSDPGRACNRAPRCASDYQARLSGPLLDRFDLNLEMPPVDPLALTGQGDGEKSQIVAKRVASVRQKQQMRFQQDPETQHWQCNAQMQGSYIERFCRLDEKGRDLIAQALNQFKFSARAYHRILKVARTLADMEGKDDIKAHHLGEALSFRKLHFVR